MSEYLSIEKVSKSFPVQGGKPGEQIWVFRDVSLALRRGEFLSMVGHSGCGKSTLLNIVAGFDRASSGGVILDGSEITGPGLDRMVSGAGQISIYIQQPSKQCRSDRKYKFTGK